MALVGQAATIAQFAGVDAYGLITMIAEAAQKVRRNRATCLQLARRAKMIGDLLRQLHAAQLMQQPETRVPVEELEETLRRAYRLVRSCQGRSCLYRCFMGARHADELGEVQSEITFYLQLFPLVSYVDTTLTLVRLLNKADPSCEEAPTVRPYFVPFLLLSWDRWCLAVVQGVYLGLQTSRVGGAVAGTGGSVHQPSAVEERRVGSISMPRSHASILQHSQEKVPLSETQELELKYELHNSNKAQVQFRCEAPVAVEFKKRKKINES